MYVSQVGHVFTVEPMINLGGYRDLTWPDNWTAVTVDGSRSAQFEHTMVVTETGQGTNLHDDILFMFTPIVAVLSGCELLTGRIGEPADRMIWNIDTFQR